MKTQYTHIQAVKKNNEDIIHDILVESKFFVEFDKEDPTIHINDPNSYDIEIVQIITMDCCGARTPIIFGQQ